MQTNELFKIELLEIELFDHLIVYIYKISFQIIYIITKKVTYALKLNQTKRNLYIFFGSIFLFESRFYLLLFDIKR